MNRLFKRILMASSSVLVASASFAQETEAACKFTYNSAIEQRVVIPDMKAKIGDTYATYGTSDPAILNDKESVSLMFSYRQKEAIDTPTYVMVLKPCSLRLLQSGEANYVTR